jgi:hypothetical protein
MGLKPGTTLGDYEISTVVWSLDYDAPFEVLPGGGGFLVEEKTERPNRIIVLLNFEGGLGGRNRE